MIPTPFGLVAFYGQYPNTGSLPVCGFTNDEMPRALVPAVEGGSLVPAADRDLDGASLAFIATAACVQMHLAEISQGVGDVVGQLKQLLDGGAVRDTGTGWVSDNGGGSGSARSDASAPPAASTRSTPSSPTSTTRAAPSGCESQNRPRRTTEVGRPSMTCSTRRARRTERNDAARQRVPGRPPSRPPARRERSRPVTATPDDGGPDVVALVASHLVGEVFTFTRDHPQDAANEHSSE